MRTTLLLLLFFSCLFYTPAIAQSNCSIPLEQREPNPNNVRARITTRGDLWWDGNNGRYIVPKVPPGRPEVAALFDGKYWQASCLSADLAGVHSSYHFTRRPYYQSTRLTQRMSVAALNKVLGGYTEARLAALYS